MGARQDGQLSVGGPSELGAMFDIGIGIRSTNSPFLMPMGFIFDVPPIVVGYSRHSSVDTSRGYVRNAEIFKITLGLGYCRCPPAGCARQMKRPRELDAGASSPAERDWGHGQLSAIIARAA
jgi:hypothetical protein